MPLKENIIFKCALRRKNILIGFTITQNSHRTEYIVFKKLNSKNGITRDPVPNEFCGKILVWNFGAWLLKAAKIVFDLFYVKIRKYFSVRGFQINRGIVLNYRI